MLAERTVPAQRRCFEASLAWARGHAGERVWAIEDCRHVSGALERFLLAHGEAVVRVAPKLTVRERGATRERGKSDAIDAVAIARAALREGLDTLRLAQLGQARARRPPALRSPRTTGPPTHRAQQGPALAPARPLARNGDRATGAVRAWLADTHRRSSGPCRADRARPHRPRRTAARPSSPAASTTSKPYSPRWSRRS